MTTWSRRRFTALEETWKQVGAAFYQKQQAEGQAEQPPRRGRTRWCSDRKTTTPWMPTSKW